jgi:hypothetical protein
MYRYKTIIGRRYRLTLFNDHSRTSHVDVVALLDRAIDHLARIMQRI